MDEAEILSRLKAYVAAQRGSAPDMQMRRVSLAESTSTLELSRVDAAIANVWASKEAVGQLNPRHPGLVNNAVQSVKKLVKRILGWHTRSFYPFHAHVANALQEEAMVIKNLDATVKVLEREVNRLRKEMLATSKGSSARVGPLPPHLLEQRRPYIEWLRGLSGEIVDLNCGRGEFLELLHSQGVPAYGVSPDSQACAVARRKSLKVVNADAVDHLRSLPERSLVAVFSSGYIERLPVEQQADFLKNLSTRLRPNGVVIIEVTNPELSGDSSANSLPPDFLSSMLQANGFYNISLFALAAVEFDSVGALRSHNYSLKASTVNASTGQCSPTGIYTVTAYRS